MLIDARDPLALELLSELPVIPRFETDVNVQVAYRTLLGLSVSLGHSFGQSAPRIIGYVSEFRIRDVIRSRSAALDFHSLQAVDEIERSPLT